MSSTKRTFTTVEIVILDINDHIPQFDSVSYQVNISEVAAINSSVVSLMVTDSDEVHTIRYTPLYPSPSPSPILTCT